MGRRKWERSARERSRPAANLRGLRRGAARGSSVMRDAFSGRVSYGGDDMAGGGRGRTLLQQHAVNEAAYNHLPPARSQIRWN